MQFLNRLQVVALILLRIAGGAIFFAHGSVKLMNPSGTMNMFAHMGFPGWVGVAIGAIEVAGGILFVLGLFTRISAVILFIEMCVAILYVHMPQGAWWDVKHYELPLACAAISLALATFGPGVVSIDHALFRDRS
ncbi:MAG TPA: DoxX family protein [Bryobacteraceae bacterium]|nr:DoxX family protein [Bryobacteraceae bacterium]